MSEARVVFGKRRDRGFIGGRTVPQALFILVALTMLVFFVRSVGAGAPKWWLLIGAVLVVPIGFLRMNGRGIADVGPAVLANSILGWMGQREYRNGPHRRLAKDTVETPRIEMRLPGSLSKLEPLAYEVGDNRGEVGVVVDRADGTVVVVLQVTTEEALPLLDTDTSNAYSNGFQRLQDALAQRENPIIAVQCLERVIPDLGEEATREWHRRGGMGSRFSRQANERVLASEVGRGIVHESYVIMRIDPSKAKSQVKEFGGGDLGAASLAFRYGAGVERDLVAAGVKVEGWLSPRAIAAVCRSAWDPSSDAMVARRGGGGGDSRGGDAGLPSGVAPSAAGPVRAKPARKYYAHNDHFSRTWWVEEYPRSRSGVAVGFLQPLLLNVPWRHSISILLEPLDHRAATRRINEAVSTNDAKTTTNLKLRRRRSKADEREEQDLARNEDDLVEGYANYHLKTVITVTASSLRELEVMSADIEAALNSCSMEAYIWYWETDQAFYVGALPLCRGIG